MPEFEKFSLKLIKTLQLLGTSSPRPSDLVSPLLCLTNATMTIRYQCLYCLGPILIFTVVKNHALKFDQKEPMLHSLNTV